MMYTEARARGVVRSHRGITRKRLAPGVVQLGHHRLHSRPQVLLSLGGGCLGARVSHLGARVFHIWVCECVSPIVGRASLPYLGVRVSHIWVCVSSIFGCAGLP